MLLSALELDAVTIAFALLGGGFGFSMGEKLRQYSPTASSAPSMFAFFGAVFSACFAYVVLYALICIVVMLALAFTLWRARPFLIVLLHQASTNLSFWYANRYAQRNLQRKIDAAHRKHNDRVQSILEMDIDPEQKTRFLEDEDRTYRDELHDLYNLN